MATMKGLKGGASKIKHGGVKSQLPNAKGTAEHFMDLQDRYRNGTGFKKTRPDHGIHDGQNIVEYHPLPIAGEGPSAAKERLALKHALMKREDMVGKGNRINWTIDDNELKIIQGWRDLVQHKNFVQWLFKKYDLRKPGMLNYVRDMFPEVVDAQMAYIDHQAELNKRIIKLQAYGPQDAEEHRLQYMLQTGQLTDNRPEAGGYIKGMLNPRRAKARRPKSWWNFFSGSEEANMEDDDDLPADFLPGALDFDPGYTMDMNGRNPSSFTGPAANYAPEPGGIQGPNPIPGNPNYV